VKSQPARWPRDAGFRMSVVSGKPLQQISPSTKSSAHDVPENCPLNAIDLTLPSQDNSAANLLDSLTVARSIADNCPAGALLRHSDEQYRLLFEGNPVPMWVFDSATLRFLAVNEAAVRQYGYIEREFLAMTIAEIRPEEDVRDLLQDVRKRGQAEGLQEPGHWRHRKKDGTIIDVEITCHSLSFHGIGSMLVAAHDITERKRAEEALLFKNALLEAQAETTIDGILAVDESDRIVLANKQFGLSFGIPDEMLRAGDDRAVRKLVAEMVASPDDFLEKVEHLYRHRDEKSSDEVRLKNGKIFERYSAPLVDANCQHRGRIWYFRDITERKAAEERIQFLAYYDALTELPHRTLLMDRLDTALAGARRRGEKLALVFLDLDRFKAINDSFGHAFGDGVLKEVAKRLKRCTRQHNAVARVGGDEFLILLDNLTDAADAAIAADRVKHAMQANFTILGRSLHVGCSVGVSLFPEHGADGETLIRNADAAMYSAKDGGRSNMRFFTDEMNAQAVERLTMEKNLRTALEREQFSLVYQPQVDIKTGRITGFEALIRWMHPELGLIPPERFISIAENNGLILPIGEWVLQTACAQARKWQDDRLPAVPVAVNVSAVQFRQEGFRELISRVLLEASLDAKYLDLELTESLLLSNADVTLSVLRELKEMGLGLSIDDFGTGYSSFSYLRHFAVDKLKIDQTFVRDVVTNLDAAAITTAIISMARSLHIKVIAECVENEAQMFFLREHLCDEIQGYYFSKPVTAREAAAMLGREQR